MSTEQSEPVAHYGDDGHVGGNATIVVMGDGTGSTAANANGTGGTNGRRRRRRRKNKGSGPAAAASSGAPASAATGEEGAMAAPVVQAAPISVPVQNPNQNQGQNNNHNGKRHKHKKRQNPGGGQNPGNNNGQNRQNRPNGGWRQRSSEGPDGNREGAHGGYGSENHFDGNSSGGRRKGGGKFGRRSFVGPMDHLYRGVNGNVADSSNSSMDYRNVNGNVLGRQELGDRSSAPVIREDAPTRIVCFIEDLFVVAKMQESARKLGVKLQFVKAEKEQLAAITDAPEAERPALIIFDLNNANAKPLTVIPKLKAKLKRGTSIIGFLGQIQGDLKMKAVEAGCDTVMPRSAFSQSVPNLLRRYGFDDTEEALEA